MPRFSSKRRVPHSATQMFDLVADVERYPEFVPLCQALKIRQRTARPDGTEVVVADMTVSFKLVRESFTSQVTLDRPNLKIIMLERDLTIGGEHTWCHFATDVSPAISEWLGPLIAHDWAGYDVRFPAHRRTLTTRYRAITSARLP